MKLIYKVAAGQSILYNDAKVDKAFFAQARLMNENIRGEVLRSLSVSFSRFLVDMTSKLS